MNQAGRTNRSKKFLQQPFDSERLLGWLVFVTVLVSTTYFFPRWADQNSNSRLDMVVAVVDDGTFQIDRYVQNTVDYAKVGDHYYSDKAPGTAFLGIPVYAGLRFIFDTPFFPQLVDRLGKSAAFQETLRAGGSGVLEEKVRFALAQVVLTILLASLPTAVTAWLLYLIGRRWLPAPLPRAAVAVGGALLTPAFAYGQALYGHQLSAALLVGALYLAIDRQLRIASGVLMLIGFLLAYAVITEYPAILAASAIGIYLLVQMYRRGELARIWLAAAPAGLVMAGWMVYNQAVFGGPLSLGYSYSEQWVAEHSTGFMSLSSPTLVAAWGITFGAYRGLFYYAPVLLIGLAGFFAWWRSGLDRALWWAACLAAAATFLFNASSVMWWGGFAVGPRYLLTALPFLTLAAIFAIQRWGQHRPFLILLMLLSLWSFLAVWGLTLAGQAYPSDTIRVPLLAYALPNWAQGNIARNAGTLLGLKGPASLFPLFGYYLAAGALLFGWTKASSYVSRNSPQAVTIHPDMQ